MFTERTDKVFRQILAFVYISADITYPAFFIGFRFWLHIVLIVRVRHRFDIRKLDALRHFTDEHDMSSQIHHSRYVSGNICIGMLCQIRQSVDRFRLMLVAGKFIHIFTRLESEVFKDLERGVFRKHRNIQSARIFYDFAGIISFVHVHCDPVRIITHLCYRVDYETIVLFSVITRNDIQTISDLEKCGRIQFRLRLCAHRQISL